jgi:hypothetical protein
MADDVRRCETRKRFNRIDKSSVKYHVKWLKEKKKYFKSQEV